MTERTPRHDSGEQAADRRGPDTSRRTFLKATATGAIAAGLGSGLTGVGAADSHGIPTPWLSVDGNQIVDPTGSEVILRGVNIADPKRLNATAPARGKTAEQVVEFATDESRGWNSRVVRIPIHPWDVAELPPVPVAEEMESPPSEFNSGGYYEPPLFTESQLVDYCENHLDPIVQKCWEENVYCIVDFHRHWGDGSLKWHDPGLEEELPLFWETVAPRYADDPHVLFEVYNEPTSPGLYGGLDRNHIQEKWRRWKDTAQPWVDIIRENAPENIVIVGSPGWSSSPEGALIEEFDGDNLAYAYHIYPGHGLTSPEDFDGREKPEGTAEVWKDVPVFTTEWGFEQLTGKRWISGRESSFGEGFKEWADNRPIHWTAWCFDPTWLPSMFDRAFEVPDATDAVGNPYADEIPEACPEPPCEWELSTGDTNMGDFVKTWLQERATDDIPTVDYDGEAPRTPSNFSASDVGQTTVDLSWDPVEEPGPSSLDHHNVYLNGDKYTEVPAGETSVTLSDLLSDTSYEIGLTGVDVAGNEGQQATVSVTTEAFDDDAAPAVPANVSVDSKDHVSLSLSWDASSDAGPSGMHHYNVYVDGQLDQQVRSDSTAATITGLTPDTTYAVQVSAVDTSQNESDPAELTVTTEVDRPGDDDLVIHDFEDGDDWPDGNELGNWAGGGAFESTELVDGTLRVQYANKGWFNTSVAEDVSEYSHLKIRLRGDDGGEESEIAVGMGNGGQAPLSELSDDAVGDRMSLVSIDMEAASWDATSPGQLQFGFNEGGSGSVYFDAIWLDTDGDDGGDGDGSDETAPTAPSSLSIESRGDTAVDLSWGTATDAGTGVDRYEVAVDGTVEQRVSAGSTTATMDGLSPGTTYDVAVTAVDAAGNVSDPATTTVTTTDSGGEEQTVTADLSVEQVSPDGTAEATITLDAAPRGVSGYDLTVSVTDTSVAQISGASYPEGWFNQGMDIADDGSSAALQAVDGGENVQEGAEDVELATVTLEVRGAGETDVGVTVEALDSDADGAPIPATTMAGTLTVADQSVAPIDGTTPQDIDGDGHYMDLNANDEIDADDVVIYFNNYDQPAITDHVEAYDYNDSGGIDFDDIVTLFQEY